MILFNFTYIKEKKLLLEIMLGFVPKPFVLPVGSTVAKNRVRSLMLRETLEPWSVYAGNPAEFIKNRLINNNETIFKLTICYSHKK
jgi:uncharacterized protein YvpB